MFFAGVFSFLSHGMVSPCVAQRIAAEHRGKFRPGFGLLVQHYAAARQFIRNRGKFRVKKHYPTTTKAL